MSDELLTDRITFNPEIFGGKAIIRGRRLAVEHVLSMFAAGDTHADILASFPWLKNDDLLACFAYAESAIRNERWEPRLSPLQTQTT